MFLGTYISVSTGGHRVDQPDLQPARYEQIVRLKLRPRTAA
jgi:hypothetical protein